MICAGVRRSPAIGVADREVLIFEPRHYLALLERKTGALDQAAPLAAWQLPDEFLRLRRLLEARRANRARASTYRCCGCSKFQLAYAAAPSRTPCVWGRSGSTPSNTSCCVASTTAGPPRSDIRICRLRTWRRPQRRTTSHCSGLSDGQTDPVAGRPSQGPCPLSCANTTKWRGTEEGLDCPRYLFRLCELELLDREQRAVERRIKAARFPVLKSLETFEFRAIPSVNKRLVLELTRGISRPPRERLGVGQLRHGQDASRPRVGTRGLSEGLSTTAAALVNELLEARDEKRLLRTSLNRTS